MSWNVTAIGKVPAVRKSVAEQFNKQKCSEPEETVRLAALSVIATALAAQDDAIAVKVEAYGSQSFADWSAKTGLSNNLSISITPLYGFAE